MTCPTRFPGWKAKPRTRPPVWKTQAAGWVPLWNPPWIRTTLETKTPLLLPRPSPAETGRRLQSGKRFALAKAGSALQDCGSAARFFSPFLARAGEVCYTGTNPVSKGKMPWTVSEEEE